MVKVILTSVMIAMLGCLSWAATDPDSSLDRYFAELEQKALNQGEIPLQKYGRSEFSQNVTRSQNYAEKGMYGEAADVLDELLEDEMASDWREMLSTRRDILRRWAQTGTVSLPDYRLFYLGTGPAWFGHRIRPIVALWKMDDVDETEKYTLLRGLLRNAGEWEGEQLVLEAVAESGNSTTEEAANAVLDIGNRHYRIEEYEQAESAWLRVRDEYPATAAWARAVFNLGRLSKRNGDFDRAIGFFSSLLHAEVNDLEPGAHIMEAYRNYRPNAQWETGNCLFAQGKYRQALEAYRGTETEYPFQSWCGNALAEYQYRYAFYQGLCHDWLGDPRTAVGLYFKAINESFMLYSNPVADLRIVDMYESAGQIEDLESVLEAMDEKHLARVERELGGLDQKKKDEIMAWAPTKTMRRILEIRAMETERDWGSLISFLKIKGTVAGPEEERVRRENWEAVEAAGLLARHADETAPLLLARFDKVGREDWIWLYYALGRCGTREAVAAIKKATHGWTSSVTNTLLYSLALAGENGEAALAELEEEDEGNLKVFLERLREGKIGEEDRDIRFPQLHNVSGLPRTVEELGVDWLGDASDSQ